MRKSFFGRKSAAVTALINFLDTPEKIRERIKAEAANGADGIAVELGGIPPEERTQDMYKSLMDAAPELPFMFILYRNDKWFGNDDEARQKYLLDAAKAGAEVIDVMGDLFDPEPFELAVKPEAIEKQKELIRKIHALGAKVIMSSHMGVFRKAEEILAHLKEQESRGADILKIVTKAESEDEFLEAVRTLLLLKKELKTPYVFLCNGKYSRLQRFLGPKLGVSLTFGVETETPTSQPTVRLFRTVLDNIHWQAE